MTGMPRDHHYIFSHRHLPRFVHQETDQVFDELSGPLREGFLMFLWQQVEKAVDTPLKPVDVGKMPGSDLPEVLKLSVVGVDKQDGWWIILLSMPPTEAPGEALFVAMARKGSRVRYFTWERSGEPGFASMGEINAARSRIGFGRFEGVGHEAFLSTVAGELGLGEVKVDVHQPGPSEPPIGPGYSSAPMGSKQGGGAGGKIGCALMVLLALLVVGGGGYLVYLEEYATSYGEPGAEVETFKFREGKKLSFQYLWEGTGYAQNEIWLVVDGRKKKGEFKLDGKFGCSRSGAPDQEGVSLDLSKNAYGKIVRYEERGKSKFSGWIRVYSEYERASGATHLCKGKLEAEVGELKKARLVLTRKQRPSDYLSF